MTRRFHHLPASSLLLSLILLLGCTRSQPCEGNTCAGHGTCRVLEVESSGPGTEYFARHRGLRRVETCDCDGVDGYDYRPVGCGPAAEFETCLPALCEQFNLRCGPHEICVTRGHAQAPSCELCPGDLQPSADGLYCKSPSCTSELSKSCDPGTACQGEGECLPCPAGQIPTVAADGCRTCPDGFRAVNGVCEVIYGRGFLVTKIQVSSDEEGGVQGHLNGQELFRNFWQQSSSDGYGLIWDQDLLLTFFFPDYAEGRPPPSPTQTDLFVYEGRFALTDLWQQSRGVPEPWRLRNPQTSERDNYFPGELSGEACARAVGVSCNPGHFSGEGLIEEKHLSTSECAPTLARLRVSYSEDLIETVVPNWLVLPYEKYGFLFQANRLTLALRRVRTGLCEESAGNDWPCARYEGHLRGVVRAIEISTAIREYTGGGISDDFVNLMLGEPDIDLDEDGVNDGFSIQFNVDLAPVHYDGIEKTGSP